MCTRAENLKIKFFRRCDGVIAVFDVMDENTFIHLKQWIDIAKASHFNVRL